jgi:KaiC/GvpD/RAD55 family RecA-like ATPase
LTTNPYEQACQAWLTKPKIIGKDALLAQAEAEGRYPTPEEEIALRGILESTVVPEHEWGAVCLLADRIRQRTAEQALTDEADAQVHEAERFLDLGDRHFLRWPWASLDALVGGMAPGTLHYIVCPSKGGKTTLCRSAVTEWCKQGKRILYGGFEMKAETLRTMAAADDCGLDPGDVLSGAWHHFERYEEKRLQMRAAYKLQSDPSHWYSRLRFTGYETVGPKQVKEMMEQAADWKADAVIIDHCDHIEGEATKNEFSVSVATNKLLLTLAKRHDLKVIITSQTNQTGKSNDRWRDHRPLRDEHVRFGDIKKQVATTMVGLIRPVKPGLTKAEKEAVEWGDKGMNEALWPGVNMAHLMASRTYGSRIGQRAYLGWDRGRIVDPPPSVQSEIQARQHGIRTNRDP